jgi:large subunit ribosomal protein L4
MPTITLKTINGESIGEMELNSDVFGAKRNIPLLHQAVVEELANRRSGTADTKTRAEVAGGGRKPYRQKGTGRARQGSIRAPHYPGGGVVWGPHPRSYDQRMPRKMRRAALKSALSAKLEDGEIVFIDDFVVDSISTKKMASILSNLGAFGKVVIAVAEITDEMYKSLRNIPGIALCVPPALSVAEVVDSDKIVMTKAAAQMLEEAFTK